MLRVSPKLAVLLLVLGLVLVFAAPALALTNTSTTTQISPGVMQRVIWGETQIFQHEVQVTHVGNLHVELKFNSSDDSNYLNVFIWDGDPDVGNFTIQNINQGWYTISDGKCVVDYWVSSISAAGKQTVSTDPYTTDDDHLLGDTYTIVVVSYNDWDSRFSIWGYASQTDVNAGYGNSTTNENNFYLDTFRYPKSGTKRLIGVPYGSPWDFKVTSEGTITTDLQYPANVDNKTVDYVPGSAPAVWEQYLYAGGDWDTVISNYLTPSGAWWPNEWGTPPDTWFGLHDTVGVAEADEFAKPQRTYHYYPNIALLAGDPAQGPFAPLATGVKTRGYKATLTYPCNMVITKAPRSVKAGAKATIKGTFALNGAWVPAGTPIQLQFKAKGSNKWVTKYNGIKVGANGTWSKQVKITKTGYWSALGVGDEDTGLAFERSASRSIKAKK